MSTKCAFIDSWEVIPLYFCKRCNTPARVSPKEHDVWGCPDCGVATDDLMGCFNRVSPWEVHRWLSFESAPKDGTQIIVWREDAGVFTANWIFVTDLNGDGDDESGHWFDNSGDDLTGDLPTLWQPLPDGPNLV